MVQRKATEIMVLETKSSEECLQELGMFNLKKKRLKGDMIPVLYNIVSGKTVWVYSLELPWLAQKPMNGRFQRESWTQNKEEFPDLRALKQWDRLL